MRNRLISRRQLLQTGVAAVAMPAILQRAIAADQSIVIGHLADTTGFLGYQAYAFDRAARAAIQKINDSGGVGGRKLAYVLEDTASNVSVGSRKYRKLVEDGKADFVIGPLHSGICLALLPVIQELKTITFLQGEAASILGAKSTRYAFRLRPTSATAARSGAQFGVERLGKKWTFFVNDFAYGHAMYDDFKPLVEAAGGSVVGKITVPSQTSDLIPFLTQVPRTTDVIFPVLTASDGTRFMQQTYDLGLSKSMARYGLWGLVDGIDLKPLQQAIEGTYVLSRTPRWLDQVPESFRSYNAEARRLIGVSPDGTDMTDPSRVFGASYYMSVWTQIFLLKKAIESSGWKSREDDKRIISYLEGASEQPSLGSPDGAYRVRAEDHQGFSEMYLEQVKGGKLDVIQTIPMEKTIYEPLGNLQSLPL